MNETNSSSESERDLNLQRQTERMKQNEKMRHSSDAIDQGMHRYAKLFDLTPVGILNLNADSTIGQANLAGASLLGVERDRLVGQRFTEYVAQSDRSGFVDLLTRSFSSSEPQSRDLALETQGDFIRFVRVDAIHISGEQGCQIILTDVTALKQAETALHDEKTFVQATLDALSANIAVLDGEGNIIAVNGACRDFAKANSANWRRVSEGTNYLDVCRRAASVGDQYAADMLEGLNAIISGTRTEWHQEYPCHAPDQKRWFYCRVSRFERNGLVRIALVHTDISEIRLAEKAKNQSDEWLRVAVKVADVGLWDWDLRTNEVRYSAEWKSQIGYEEHEIANDSNEWRSRVHPEDIARVEKVVEEYLKNPASTYQMDFRLRHKDGSYRWIATNAALVYDEQSQPIRMVGSHVDITDRKSVEQQLRMRDRAVQATTQGIIITDPNLPGNPVIYVNPGFESITGYSYQEVVGKNCRMLQGKDTDPTTAAQISAAIKERRPCSVNILNYRKNGSAFWNELSISPVRDADGNLIHFVAVQADVTQRQDIEDQLRQSQKMDAIGQLAGGIAHDFNNMLTVINGYSAILLKDNSLNASAREILGEIQNAGDRAADLTRKLLAFGRRQILRLELLDFNVKVVQSLALVKPLIGEHILIDTALDPRLKRISADRSQINQLLLNLVINARDAMPDGGRLTIATRYVAEDQMPAGHHLSPNSDGYVELTVSDTGTGMSPQVQTRIFEPFFTTKPVGEGTGLGLSTVYGIVKQFGGEISLTSEVDKGTTFHVYFPCVPDPAQSDPLVVQVAASSRGSEVILVVEDEDLVRNLVCTVLSLCGYTILEAVNGQEAMEIAAKRQEPIALILTDVTMPGMSGPDLVEAITKLHPNIRAILMSGYSDEVALTNPGSRQFHFLPKPFLPNDVETIVRQVLDLPIPPDRSSADEAPSVVDGARIS